MKKLICVMALVCIGILLVSCGSNRPGDPKAQLMRDFALHIDKKDCVLEELFNNYEGFPYEGIALYKLTVGEDVRQAFLQWERFPFSEEAECFLESLSAYVGAAPDRGRLLENGGSKPGNERIHKCFPVRIRWGNGCCIPLDNGHLTISGSPPDNETSGGLLLIS